MGKQISDIFKTIKALVRNDKYNVTITGAPFSGSRFINM